MTETCPTNQPESGGMGFFERYLTVWVGLCIVAGVLLGKLAPRLRAIARCDGDYR